MGANGAVEAGHEAEVTLLADAVYLMRDEVAASSIGPGPTSR